MPAHYQKTKVNYQNCVPKQNAVVTMHLQRDISIEISILSKAIASYPFSNCFPIDLTKVRNVWCDSV